MRKQLNNSVCVSPRLYLKSIDYLTLTFLIVVSGIIMFHSNDNNVVAHIMALAILSFGACFIVKFDLLHPYCWFSIFFFLYHCSYAILYSKDQLITNYGYNKLALVYNWIALLVFLIIVSPRRHKTTIVRSKMIIKITSTSTIMKYFLVISNLIIFCSIIVVLFNRYTSKSSIYNSNSFFISISFQFCIFATLIASMLYYCKSYQKGKPCLKTIFYGGTLLAIFSLLVAERGLLLRYLLVIVMISYSLGFVKKKNFLLLAAIGFLLIVFLNIFKHAFLRGEIKHVEFSLNSLVNTFLGTDFCSAGINLQILLSDPKNKGLFNGHNLLSEFVNPFYNTGISHIRWYHFDYIKKSTSTLGFAFTIIGCGYLELGVPGIVLVFVLISLIIKNLYIRIAQNIYIHFLYVFAIPTYIFALRGELATIIGQLTKYGVLVLATLHFIYIFKHRYGVTSKLE